MAVGEYTSAVLEAILGGIFLGVGAPLIVDGFAATQNTSLVTIGSFVLVALGLGLVFRVAKTTGLMKIG